jgi:hypothetical protein
MGGGGWVELNVDATLPKNGSFAAAAAVARDATGCFLGGVSDCYGGTD